MRNLKITIEGNLGSGKTTMALFIEHLIKKYMGTAVVNNDMEQLRKNNHLSEKEINMLSQQIKDRIKLNDWPQNFLNEVTIETKSLEGF